MTRYGGPAVLTAERWAVDAEVRLRIEQASAASQYGEAREWVIARTEQTCRACPSQWYAWTAEDEYLHLHYRRGVGTVERHPGPDVAPWDKGRLIARWDDGTSGRQIGLSDFLAAAGLTTASPLHVYGIDSC
ncbi:hypothetical protein [Sinosporangium siamense]|uniref:Uncharacterized protein n=1 Tax=Sinosporangium siamense TaxID=1367973 RepID=A0A919VA86_9ACTN|nr:hypothetical protein [Sinosporangium siamense]GII95147.1 hypothetical protein Ssi02_53780 [Sinosporangium siamense]